MANPFVEFLGSGADAVSAGVEKIGTLFENMAKKGVAAMRTMRDGINKMTDALRTMSTIASVAGIISAGAIARFVAVAQPAVMDQFRLATQQVAGVLGQMFAPIVMQVTAGVRELAKWLYNLSPTAKAAIAAIAVGSVAAVTAIGAMTAAMIIFGAVTNLATGGLAIVLGVIVGAIAATAGALGAGAGAAAYFGYQFKEIKDALWQAWSVIKQIGSAVWSVLSPLWEAAKKAWSAFKEAMIPAFLAAKDAAASLVAAFQSLTPDAKGLADIIGEGLAAAARFAASAFEVVARAIETVIDKTMKAIITMKELADAARTGRLMDLEGTMKIIDALHRQYDIRKKNAREEMGKERGKGKEPPMFGMQARFSGIAEAKDEFQMASLRASAGLQKPEERAANAAEQQVREQQQTNAWLEQLARNARENAPRFARIGA